MHLVGYALLAVLGISIALYLWSGAESTSVKHGDDVCITARRVALATMLLTAILTGCVLLGMTTLTPIPGIQP